MKLMGLIIEWNPEKEVGLIFADETFFFFYRNSVVSGEPSPGAEAQFFVSSRKPRPFRYADCVRIVTAKQKKF